MRQVWTTNWDELIETAFLRMRPEADVKERPDDLTYERVGADATVYKMHEFRYVTSATSCSLPMYFELYRIKREALPTCAGRPLSFRRPSSSWA